MNDNYIHPFNALQQRDELFLPISPTTLPRPQQDLLHVDPHIDSPNRSKKIVHRDVERQRRQEMSSLYTSLRSLLPHEYVKGKRSISDHMNQATNYIKHLEKKTQDYKKKRDELKGFSSSCTGKTDIVSEGSGGLQFASVVKCWHGVEVVVGMSSKAIELVPLSKVLQVLSEEGYSTLSCVSSTANERLLHKIYAEVEDRGASNDPSSLKQKLMNLVRLQVDSPI